MTKILSFVACVAFSTAVVTAQRPGDVGSFPGCPTCGVYAWVDLPAPEVTVSAQTFTLQGWGFECVSGAPADRVDVFYQDYDGVWQPLPQGPTSLSYGAVGRPDVVTAYRPWCSNVPLFSGWVLTVTNPPPVGLRRVLVNVWRGPYMSQSVRTYLITP